MKAIFVLLPSGPCSTNIINRNHSTCFQIFHNSCGFRTPGITCTSCFIKISPSSVSAVIVKLVTLYFNSKGKSLIYSSNTSLCFKSSCRYIITTCKTTYCSNWSRNSTNTELRNTCNFTIN